MPPDNSLPPYRPSAPPDAANAAEPPSYEDAPSTSRQARNTSSNGNTPRLLATAHAHAPGNSDNNDDSRLDEKNRRIQQQHQQAHPQHPPPGYFASLSTDCPHWVTRQCRLTAWPRHCCTCMDKRPDTADGRYPVYMDGYSELGSVVRWAHYCEPCRNAESRLHNNHNTRARPPPRLTAYRASGNEQARAAREMADKKLQIELRQESDNWWDKSVQRRQQEQRERQERKEQRRACWEAKKEAAEKTLDDAWEADQLQRLSKGESVSGITVRRHFLMANPSYQLRQPSDKDTKGKGKGKGKGKEKEKSVIGIFKECAEPTTAEPEADPAIKPITAADVREARKMWEAGRKLDERARKRWEEIEASRVQEELEAVRRATREAEQRHYEEQVAAKQRNEYEAYGDGAEVHRSVTRTVSREAGGGSSSSTSRWFSRLFGRRDARR